MLTETFVADGYSKNCFKWSYRDSAVTSTFYIHEWRVPQPVPKLIKVSFIFNDFLEDDDIIKLDCIHNKKLKRKTIIRRVQWEEGCHSPIVKYCIDGSDGNRPFPTIYIPTSFLVDNLGAREVQVIVNWN